jgi:molecular chaperone HscB
MLNKNFFELLSLPVSFAIDPAQLDHNYRSLQAEVHPDRFAAAAPAERLHSLQLATRVNEAYQTLKSPVSRARYLLQMNGIDTQEETNTAMPADFLMQQMEWREAIEEGCAARDIDALDGLQRELLRTATVLETELHERIDRHRDYAGAAQAVRKLRFLDKVRDEIERAIDALDE